MSETGQDGMGRGETSPDPRPNGSTAETQLHENFNMFLFRPGTSYPAMMQIETTSRCNLKCPNCRRTIEFPDAADAQSEHVLEKLRDPIARLDSLAISGWGESLMGRSLGAVLDLAASAGAATSITTNGTLLAESKCREILDKKVTNVTISIDAGTPEGYARLRPGGVPFEKVIEGAARLIRMKKERGSSVPGVHLAMVFHDDSATELAPLLRLVHDRLPDIKAVVLQILYFSDFTPDAKTYRLSEKSASALAEGRNLARKLGIAVEVDMPEQMELDLGRRPPQIDGFISMPSLNQIRENRLVPTCNSAWENPFIDSAGNVYPCCVYPESFGNLHESTFQEIWNGAKFTEMRVTLHNGNPSEHCRNCRKTLWYENHCDPETKSVAYLDTPGFIGMGWYSPEKTRWGTGFRWSREYADIFLKNNGKPRLFIEAASVPEGREVEIAIDGSSVGQLRVPHRWGLLTLPVGPQEGEILRISLRVKGVEKYPKDRECWWPRRSLGVAVTQIGLCAESEFIPPRNPVTFSQKLLRTLAYKSSSLLRRNPA